MSMMADLKARGLKVFGVGKAYDDDLYAWVYDSGRGDLEYQEMKVVVFKAPEMAEDFERFSYGLQMVSLSIVEEVLREERSLRASGFLRSYHICFGKIVFF